MPTIVYQTNPKTGVKYAYESVSYWDKDKKAPRSKRRYLGRVDPETGEIIMKKTRKDSESPTGSPADGFSEDKDAEIADLKEKLAEMTSLYEDAMERLRKIAALVSMRED